MYFKNSTEQEAKSELLQSLDYHEKAAEAWRAVEILKTKSGAEYKNIRQAVKGATIEGEAIFPRLQVSFRAKNERGGDSYFEDWAECYFDVRELAADDKRERFPKVPYLKETAPKTVDEMRAAILERRQYHEAKAEEVRKWLDILPQVFSKYRQAIQNAEDELAAAVGRYNTIYWAITNTKGY